MTIGDRLLTVGDLALLQAGQPVEMIAGPDGAKVMLLGGATMDGPRHIWWNFVSSSKERIERAKADWRDGRFAKVPGDAEFIPLPDK
jgi:redox-sensitive bicupin YhaK (pirin superfamily)